MGDSVPVGTLLALARQQQLTGRNQLDQARTLLPSANLSTLFPNNQNMGTYDYTAQQQNNLANGQQYVASGQNVTDANNATGQWNSTFANSPVYNPNGENSYAILNGNQNAPAGAPYNTTQQNSTGYIASPTSGSGLNLNSTTNNNQVSTQPATSSEGYSSPQAFSGTAQYTSTPTLGTMSVGQQLQNQRNNLDQYGNQKSNGLLGRFSNSVFQGYGQ